MLCIMSSKFSLYSVGWGEGSGSGREIKLHFSWRGEQTLFGILLYGMSFPFVYLFNHLFILVWTLVYLGCNPIPHYLFYYSKFSSGGSCVPSTCPHALIYCFSTSLVSGTKRCPSPRISHFSEKVQSFYWRMGFRNQALGTYGFPHSSVGKEPACNAGDPSSIPGLGRSPAEGIGYPLQYSGLENPMDFVFHGVAKSRT